MTEIVDTALICTGVSEIQASKNWMILTEYAQLSATTKKKAEIHLPY